MIPGFCIPTQALGMSTGLMGDGLKPAQLSLCMAYVVAKEITCQQCMHI